MDELKVSYPNHVFVKIHKVSSCNLPELQKEKFIISKYIKHKIEKSSFVAIRSAFAEEDGEKSFAGAFSTLLNIDIEDNKIEKEEDKKDDK